MAWHLSNGYNCENHKMAQLVRIIIIITQLSTRVVSVDQNDKLQVIETDCLMNSSESGNSYNICIVAGNTT